MAFAASGGETRRDAMAVRDNLREIFDDLRTQRDELALKLHLARADARDEWEALEKTWEHLKARVEVVGREAGEVAEDVGDAARGVLDELKKGYARLRTLVS
jgi:archaellum component FlaC